MSYTTLLESPTVSRLPARKEYGVEKTKDVNAKIFDGIMLYRYHLAGVENGLIRFVTSRFKAVFAMIDSLLNDKNLELMTLLSDARVQPSATPIKESSEVAVALTSVNIMEAKKPKAKSPLTVDGVNRIADYLVREINARMSGELSVVNAAIRAAVLQVATMEPKIVADVIRKTFPPSVAAKLKGGIIITDEMPLERLVSIVLGGAKHNAALRKRYGKALDKVESMIVSGLLQGKGIKPIATNIRGILSKDVAGGAAMLARTEIQRASARSNKELYGNNKDIIKGEVWMATFDTDVCIQCFNLDGKYFAVGVGPQPIDDTHPNCRCLRSPVVKSWRELGVNIKDAPIGFRATMGGAIPARITFQDWFQKQSSEVKKEILGKTRYELYQSGELELKDLSTNSRILTIKQLKKRYKIK